jgi:hypothetical protein
MTVRRNGVIIEQSTPTPDLAGYFQTKWLDPGVYELAVSVRGRLPSEDRQEIIVLEKSLCVAIGLGEKDPVIR